MTQLQRKFSTPSLCAFIGGIQVSETSWFIALCRLALTIPKPYQREPFLATDPGAAHATSQVGRQRSATPAEMFDCTAAGVVYVITCQRCHKLCIGETGRRLSDRFGEHLRSVEGFKQNPRYKGGGFPVAEHFNLPDHNKVHDVRVSVVRQVEGGAPTRQRQERRLIVKLVH